MRNSGGVILFLTVILTIVIGGFVYFYLQFLPQNNQQNAVKCKNEWSIISFLIDDEKSSVIMAGEYLDPKGITIFNKTAIAAHWGNKKAGTKIFLDRIAGHLEIKTTSDQVEWKKEEFECNSVHSQF